MGINAWGKLQAGIDYTTCFLVQNVNSMSIIVLQFGKS